MTKAVICQTCSDIVSPYRDWRVNRSWRWCLCQHVATRWRDGDTGQLEVVSLHGADYVRVLGIHNEFLIAAFQHQLGMHEDWRDLHSRVTTTVEPYYLFNEAKRNCWAVLIRPGDTNDTHLMDYGQAWSERAAVADER